VDGGCTANWGGLGGSITSGTFWDGTPVSTEVNNLINSGRKVVIAWGGAGGSVLSSCGSSSSAHAMYQSAKNMYPGIAGQDFDIEGGINLSVFASAISGLSGTSVTLPVMPTGLVSAGLSVVSAVHGAGVHPVINVMTMDYGSANDNGGNMLLSAQQAAQNTRNQTGDPIGITPMIGVNDTATEVFTLSNASSLTSWAKGQSYVSRLAFWSLGRDNGSCAGQTSYASATCSGLSQSTWAFANAMKGF
jgi:chitinase